MITVRGYKFVSYKMLFNECLKDLNDGELLKSLPKEFRKDTAL